MKSPGAKTSAEKMGNRVHSRQRISLLVACMTSCASRICVTAATGDCLCYVSAVSHATGTLSRYKERPGYGATRPL